MFLNDLESDANLFRALEQIYMDGNPIRAMILLTDLTDLGIKHGLITEADRSLLAQLHLILGEIAILRETKNRTH
jgi:hypothetical protein